MKKFSIFLGVIFIIAFSAPAFSMTITAMDTADNLANALLEPGSGATISNVSYTGTTAASGYFTGGTAAGIGIEEGIVLTSGWASNLNGTSNTSDAITGSNGLAGTSYLDALIPGYTTNDATVLSFDFTTPGDAAYFTYVFGSDEYNEYANTSFNDVFGFFLDGTDVLDNQALIPGTSIAVSINNINEGEYSTYYNNNDPSDTSVPFAFEYDGFTDPFQVSMTGLNPGQTYHLTLAIADAGDTILDSGVFLKGESFSPDPEAVPEPATMLLLGSGLLGFAGFRRKFKK